MDPTLQAGASLPTPPSGIPGLHARVVAGLAEAVVVVAPRASRGHDDPASRHVVAACNPAAERLLPGIAVGLPVARVGPPAFVAALDRGATTFEAGIGDRLVAGRAVPLEDAADGPVCWYVRDVTDERRGTASLRAAQDGARFLAEAGRALHGVLHLDRTLRTAAGLAASGLAPTALVLLADATGGLRWARAARGGRPVSGELPSAALRAAPHTAALVAGAEVVDPRTGPELADLPVWDGRPTGPIRVVVVPGTVTRGLLVLVGPDDDRAVPGASGPDDGPVPLVAEFAVRVGSALAAAALYREQAHLGEVLQSTLAPPPLPHAVPGLDLGSVYRPARETLRVGGDFYEVLPVAPGGETPFLLGDVCGKGIEAAVLSGRVRQSLHALRLVEQHPARLLPLLNAALLDAADLDVAAGAPSSPRFATMVLGDARPARDGTVTLRLATGGHPPPYVLAADGTVTEVAVEGALVGALRDAAFAATEVVLAPGETCLLYSDGVTEARGGPTGREFFGEERLEAALAGCRGAPAQVVCERVLHLLADWLGGRDHDDIALLALAAPRPAPAGAAP